MGVRHQVLNFQQSDVQCRPLRGPRDKYSHLWEETNDTNLRRVSYSGIQCRPLRGPQDKYSLAVSFRLLREETNDTNIAQRLATRQYSDTILTLQVPSSTLSSDLALGLNSNGSIIVTG